MAILNSLFGDTRKTGFQNPFASITSPLSGYAPMPIPRPTGAGTVPSGSNSTGVISGSTVTPHPLPREITTLPAATSQGGGILGQLFGNRNPFPNAWQGGGWGNTAGGTDWLSQLFGRLQNWRGGA